MAVTRARRSHSAGGPTAVLTAAPLRAPAPPAHAAYADPVAGAGSTEAGSVGGSHIVPPPRDGAGAVSKAGRAVAVTCGARTGHIHRTALTGHAAPAGERPARCPSAAPRTVPVSRDAEVAAEHRREDPPCALDRVGRLDLPLDRGHTRCGAAGQGGTVHDTDTDTGVQVARTSAGTAYGLAKQAQAVAGNGGLPAHPYSPARVKKSVAVGAGGKKDAGADFSNRGARGELFTLGVDVTSASDASDTTSATSPGTSMASPHAAGAAGLFLADRSTAAPAAVGRALTRHAAAGKPGEVGPGSPNGRPQVDNS